MFDLKQYVENQISLTFQCNWIVAIIEVAAALGVTLGQAGASTQDTRHALAEQEVISQKEKASAGRTQARKDTLSRDRLKLGKERLIEQRSLVEYGESERQKDIADIKGQEKMAEAERASLLFEPTEDRLQMQQNRSQRWGI